MNDPLTDSVLILTNYFDNNGIEYVLVGGISVIILGRVRTTMDLDVIVNHHQILIPQFVKFLQHNGFSAVASDFLGFKENINCNVFLKEGMFRIDFKGIYKESDRRAIDMAIEVKFMDKVIKINHPVNIIAYKLYFGSEQDYEDALAVYIRNQDDVDLNKLRLYCKELGVESLLDKFLKEIEEFEMNNQ